MPADPSHSGLLSNMVAVVTGGASGIGEAICRAYAAQGATVAVADINGFGARSVVQSIEASGGQAIALEVDVCDTQQVAEAVAGAIKQLGAVDILVNCAGFNTFAAPEEVTTEQWVKLRSVNLDGTWHMCQAVMQTMMAKGGGRIINIASAAGMLGIPKAIPYTVAKHGVVGLTRALAVDLGPYNVNVNCICPATVETPLARAALTQVFFDEMTKRIPLRRLGKPSDIADAALFLASSASSWITGVILPVDGGLTCCLRAQHYE